MNKKRIIILSTSLVILIIGIVAGAFLVRQQLTLQRQAAPATTLELVASDSTPAINDNFDVTVKIDTAQNLTIGSELYIVFNSQKLEALDITPGSFYPSVRSTNKLVDNDNGRISLVVFIPTDETPQSGQGTVATINFRAIAAGSATIDFTPSTLVAAVGEDVGQDVLANTISETVTIEDPSGPQPSPTPTPTEPATAPSPTPTPTSGFGGVIDPTPTTTPTTAPDSPTSTPTPGTSTTTSTPTPTPSTLPDAGDTLPTIILTGFGILFLVAALTLFAI